jgi:hypothetical protein
MPTLNALLALHSLSSNDLLDSLSCILGWLVSAANNLAGDVA